MVRTSRGSKWQHRFYDQDRKAAQTSDDSVSNEAPSSAYNTNGVAAYTPAGVLKRLWDAASDLSGPRPAY
jgi:hypothetical protein